MIKKISLLAIVAAVVLSCESKQAQKVEEMKDTVSAEIDTLAKKVETKIENTGDALKTEGIYKGTIPCADCEGIDTKLMLSLDNTYTLTVKYLGKGDGKETVSKGKYTKEGDIVKLDKDNIQYKLSTGKLTQLDQEGKEITGELAPKYVLKEVSDIQYMQNN